jgi:hypothetical protein
MQTSAKNSKSALRARSGKAPRKARTLGDHLPGFAPTVNWSAGPAASGVRIGFPAERTVTLNYVSTNSVYQATAGVMQKYQFRLNSVYDPDYTAAGHQPMGFDQWAAYYNHYVVEECTYDVQMSTRETSDNTYMGTYLSDDFTIASTATDLVELGGTIAIQESSSALPHIFKGRVNIGKFMNRKDIASDSELRAAVTADPTEQVFLTWWFLATNTTNQVTIDVVTKLSYRVRFMEPKDLAPSSTRVHPPATSEVDFPSLPTARKDSPCPIDGYEYVRVARKPAHDSCNP